MPTRRPDSEPQAHGGGDRSAPSIADGIPERCLSLTISADWGHFRRIDRTVTKQTYRIPPRTTVAGILAAIAGVRRDGYYDTFAQARSAVAIEPVGSLRTVAVPTLGVGTNPDESFASAGGTGRKTVKVYYPDGTDNRQIHSYHHLVNPAYRIDVAVEDDLFYDTLASQLAAGRSYYPPSMGVSEHLATVEFHGECTVDPVADVDETVAVDSALPDAGQATVPKSGVTYNVERVPAFMQADESGRRTTGYTDYTFTEEESIEARSSEFSPVKVDGRTVVFS